VKAAVVSTGFVVKAVITAVVGALITGFSAWGVHLSSMSNNHEKRIAVTETQMQDVKDDISEIKASLKEQNRDTKEILKRLPRRN